MNEVLLYSELEDFMHWIAWKNVDDNNVMMNHDDIFGELQIEFVKSLKHYGHLPKKQFINVTKRMIDNRIAELRYKYYKTHRGLAANMLSIDDDFIEDLLPDIFDLEAYVELEDFVEDIRDRMRGLDLEIFDILYYGDERMTELLKLVGMRSSYVYSGRGTIRRKAWHIADILAISISEVKASISHIEVVVRSVL